MNTSTIMMFFGTILILLLAQINAQSGDATYYELGLTACGKVFTNNDLVAATAFSYWRSPNPNNDAMCGKRARVTDPATGKSVEVMIKDKCSGCARGDIDLSPAAFKKLRKLEVGRFHVNWKFI